MFQQTSITKEQDSDTGKPAKTSKNPEQKAAHCVIFRGVQIRKGLG